MKRTNYLGFLLLTIIAQGCFTRVNAQLLRHYFNKEKTEYIGFASFGQFWVRHANLNPGSTIDGVEQSDIWDMSVRRIRLKVYGQHSEKTRFLFSVGNNNLSRINKNTSNKQLKILDAYVEHQWKEYLGFGIGKNAWTGLSRYAAPSTSGALGVDIQYIATPLINYSDDFLRKVSLYAKGQIGNWDYRLVLAQPCAPVVTQSVSPMARVSPQASDYQTSTYIKYNFKDKESQKSPFVPGTYLGKKNILTIGVGGLYQPRTTYLIDDNDTSYYAARSLAIDIYYEHPLSKKNILTIYGAYFNHDLGPDFIRSVGPNNPANGSTGGDYLNGRGNSAIVTGTGHIYFLQGAVLRKWDEINGIQLYGSFEYGRLKALDQTTTHWETGINYFLNGQKSKLTLGYQNWPIIKREESTNFMEKRGSSITLQYQFKIG